jgi:hypothetical protein
MRTSWLSGRRMAPIEQVPPVVPHVAFLSDLRTTRIFGLKRFGYRFYALYELSAAHITGSPPPCQGPD